MYFFALSTIFVNCDSFRSAEISETWKSSNLLSDSFTKMGITPFWPYSRTSKGLLVSGGVVERGIFASFVIVDVLLLFVYLV